MQFTRLGCHPRESKNFVRFNAAGMLLRKEAMSLIQSARKIAIKLRKAPESAVPDQHARRLSEGRAMSALDSLDTTDTVALDAWRDHLDALENSQRPDLFEME